MNKDRKKELDTLLNADSEKGGEAEDKEEEKDDESEDDDNKKDNEEESEENDENEEDENEDEKNNKKKEDEESDDDEENKEDKKSRDKIEVEKDEEGEGLKNKDKWHGKSREEVIKMYEDLDGKKPPKLTISDTKVETGKSDAEDGVKVPSDEELAKMTPKQFAEWMVSTVKNIVSDTYDTRSRMRDSVTQEIRDTQKDHPLLKTSSEYRELVLSLIDTASQKGTIMSLKEACEKVDGFVGKVKGETKVTDTEKIRLKKAKAQVERGAGAPTSHGEDKGAEERRLEQIFGTSGSKSPLGGLGV